MATNAFNCKQIQGDEHEEYSIDLHFVSDPAFIVRADNLTIQQSPIPSPPPPFHY